MEMIQVINGEIKQYSLPKLGTLKDGSTVSGYHLLDEEILLEEGWLPLEDNPPLYDIVTEQLIENGYEILENKVVKKYQVTSKAEPKQPVPSKIETLQAQVLDLQKALDIVLGRENV